MDDSALKSYEKNVWINGKSSVWLAIFVAIAGSGICALNIRNDLAATALITALLR
jgi:hypothetical protein